MANEYQSSLDEVIGFLRFLTQLINSKNFNIKTDFDYFDNTENDLTLMYLGYDAEDVCYELSTLTPSNYYHTLTDDRYKNSSPLYVFCKQIQNRDVYIKIKIREWKNNQIFCLSFHFAKYPFSNFPFAP